MTRPTKVWVGRGGRIKKSFSEKVVKQNIMEYLALKKVFAWNNPRGAGKVRPTAKKPEGSFMSWGGPKGASDILGVLPGGRFLAIETKKTHGGVKSEEQKQFIDNINEKGGLAFFAKNLDEAIEHLKPILGGW